MKIQVELLAQLRVAAGTPTIGLDCPVGTTLAQALQRIAPQPGSELRALVVEDNGSVRSTILASIGGRQVRGERVLADGETIVLGTPISGG